MSSRFLQLQSRGESVKTAVEELEDLGFTPEVQA